MTPETDHSHGLEQVNRGKLYKSPFRVHRYT